ncbi:MAG: hypothetical protein R6U95_07825, partial [Bacteroidales bacterium]
VDGTDHSIYPPERVGGLAGCIEYRGELVNSYSTGLVSVNNSDLSGGFLGNIGSGGNIGVVTDSFWDTETSGQDSSAGGTGKTTAEMKTKTTYTNAGWDLTNTWDIASSTNDGYPVLYNTNNTYLPIELSDFSVSDVREGKIELYWETASEVNNEKFLVQRSVDGVQFTTIAEVVGHGNSSYIHTYSYIDTEVSLNTMYYYRLQQVDYNGDFSFSPIISVFYSQKQSLSIEYVNKGIIISALDNIEYVAVYNPFGQRVFNCTVCDSNNVFVPITKKGVFFVIVKGRYETFQKKLILK